MSEGNRIHRKMFVADHDDHEVGYQLFDKATGEKVDRTHTVKKIDTEYGFVYVEDAEIEQMFDLVPKSLSIQSFHPIKLWDERRYVEDKLYYIEPTRATRRSAGSTSKSLDPTSNAALGLLLAGMEKEHVFAFCEWVSRGIPKPAVLLPNGELWTVHYEEQLREQRPQEFPKLPKSHIDQVRALIKSMESDDVPTVTDTYSVKIQEFADQKGAAGDYTRPVEVPAAEAPETSEFLRGLMASLKQAS